MGQRQRCAGCSTAHTHKQAPTCPKLAAAGQHRRRRIAVATLVLLVLCCHRLLIRLLLRQQRLLLRLSHGRILRLLLLLLLRAGRQLGRQLKLVQVKGEAGEAVVGAGRVGQLGRA